MTMLAMLVLGVKAQDNNGDIVKVGEMMPSFSIVSDNGTKINSAELKGKVVLINFFATWCQPCKAMHPILEQVKSVLGDRIRIIKVDVDKYGVTASQYRIQSVPTLMLFRNGEVLWRTSGVVDKAELLATLDPFLK